ncbi:unnamed protein product, partial [marine sediment metagenome]
MKRLFNLHTIGGWAGIGCFAYMIFFYLDTGVILFPLHIITNSINLNTMDLC